VAIVQCFREFLKCISYQKAQKIQKESNQNLKETHKQNNIESVHKNTAASKQLPNLILENSINRALLGNYGGQKMKPAQIESLNFKL
jgi:hypothetical protein